MHKVISLIATALHTAVGENSYYKNYMLDSKYFLITGKTLIIGNLIVQYTYLIVPSVSATRTLPSNQGNIQEGGIPFCDSKAVKCFAELHSLAILLQ